MAKRNRKPQARRSGGNPPTGAASVATGANGAGTSSGVARVAAPAITTAAPATESTQSALATRFGARRIDVAISLGFVLIALCLYFWRIEVPWNGNWGYIYDEVYHAYTAEQYVNGNADAWIFTTKSPVEGTAYEWTHPPLGKEIIAVGIWLNGNTLLGWRFTSAIFGAIGIALIYWLALVLTRRRTAAIFAAILTLADGLYFVQSRGGLLDIYGAVFMVGAFIAFYKYLAADATQVRWPLVGMGLGLGLGIATKWNAAYGAAVVGLIVMLRTLFLLAKALTTKGEEKRASQAGFVQHLIWVPLGMAVLPALIYMITYIPFFAYGFGWDLFKQLQWQMYNYHSTLKATHAYQSQWWQWILAQRPVWYGVKYEQNGVVGYTYANGNPLLYWSFFAAIPYALYLWWRREKYPQMLVLTIGFFGQWLPWALIPRIAYAYHFLPASIFGFLAVAVTLDDFWQLGTRQIGQGRPPIWRYAAIAYAVVIVGAFVFFYPYYSGWPLTPDQFNARIWFDKWK